MKNMKIAINAEQPLDEVVAICDTRCKTNNTLDKQYFLWKDVVKRCLDKNFKDKHPTYKDCTISSEWLHYSSFKNDVSNMVGFGKDGFQIDKDLIVRGNKHYSIETCCFLPHEINTFLAFNRRNKGKHPIGVNFNKRAGLFVAKISIDNKRYDLGYFENPVDAHLRYKEKKELHAKVLAKRWKSEISLKAYNALMRFEVVDTTLTELRSMS